MDRLCKKADKQNKQGNVLYLIRYATINGLFKGVAADMFGPDIPVTRGMFVTILSRLEFGGDENIPAGSSEFTDLQQDWYKNPVAWAYGNKITLGVSETQFNPEGVLTREQMAVFLYNYAQFKGYDLDHDVEALNVFADMNQISAYAKTAMSWAVQHGLLAGVTETTLVPQGQATRAQCAAIFMRFVSFVEQQEVI